MKTIIYILLLISGTAFISSCQKVIDVDLNSAHPQIVIEAKINDQPGEDTVKISKTANYFGDISFPKVSGAIVMITDDKGKVDTLHEIAAGVYHKPGFTGSTHTKYTISVQSEGKTYTASSTIPEKTMIDSLSIGASLNPFSHRKSMLATCHFKDVAGVANYYNLKEYVNDTFYSSNTGGLLNDKLSDGNEISFPFTHRLNKGDTVKIYLQSIDDKTFDYLSSLSTTISGGATSLSPANPNSNFNNGALGYFTAYAIDSKTITVK